MKMKLLHYGVCFALCISMETKEIRQISRLIPLEDWIDFKNRTRDVRPLDKFIGKLRATYDFVFHKSDDVTNVEKILDNTNENSSENTKKPNTNVSFIERKKSSEIDVSWQSKNEMKKENNENHGLGVVSMKKNISNDRPDRESIEDNDKLKNHENQDDTLVLERLEILDDDNASSVIFDEETDDLEKKNFTPTNFALPYAIARAFVRWIISIYLSASNNFNDNDNAGERRELNFRN